jgi:hypothetical protein
LIKHAAEGGVAAAEYHQAFGEHANDAEGKLHRRVWGGRFSIPAIGGWLAM